jgi:hypothetical protein
MMAATSTPATLADRIAAARAAGIVLVAADLARLHELDAFRAKALASRRGHTDTHLDAVARHFPLGTVGGSGRAVRGLNRRRERALEATIAAAVHDVPLEQKAQTLAAAIDRILSGEDNEASRAAQRARRDAAQQQLAHRLSRLAKGDVLAGHAVLAISKDRDGYPSRVAYRDADGMRQSLPIVKALFGGNTEQYRQLMDGAREAMAHAPDAIHAAPSLPISK